MDGGRAIPEYERIPALARKWVIQEASAMLTNSFICKWPSTAPVSKSQHRPAGDLFANKTVAGRSVTVNSPEEL